MRRKTLIPLLASAMAVGMSLTAFAGTWKSNKTKKSKLCAWGQYRVPNSGGLDVGAGEFSVNPKYAKNGWGK